MENNGEKVELYLKKSLLLLKRICPPSSLKLKVLKDCFLDRSLAEELLYYLLQIINKQKCYLLKWPVYNTKDSIQFRGGVMKFISECVKENPGECYPTVSQRTLLKPQSIEFKTCLLKLSHTAIKVKKPQQDKQKFLPSNPESCGTSDVREKMKSFEKELKKRIPYERLLQEEISNQVEGINVHIEQLKAMDCFSEEFLLSLQTLDDLNATILNFDFLHSNIEAYGEEEFVTQNDLVSYVHAYIIEDEKQERSVLDGKEILKDVDLDALSLSAETNNIKLFNKNGELRLEGLIAQGKVALESSLFQLASRVVENVSDLLPNFIALSSERFNRRQQLEKSIEVNCNQASKLKTSCEQAEAAYYDSEEEEVNEDLRVIINENPLLNSTPILKFGGLEEIDFADSPLENLNEFLCKRQEKIGEARGGPEKTPTGPHKARALGARTGAEAAKERLSSSMSPLAKCILSRCTLPGPSTTIQPSVLENERTLPEIEPCTTLDESYGTFSSYQEISPVCTSSWLLDCSSSLKDITFSDSSDEEIINFPSLEDFTSSAGSVRKKRKSLEDIINRFNQLKAKQIRQSKTKVKIK